MKKIQYGLGALIILLASLPAVAADFLFQVPVMLDGIPKGIPQAKIVCEVFSYRDNQNPIATGYKIKPIDLRDGHLHQEFEVSVNYFNEYRHLKPHQYHCTLLLLTPWAKPTWQVPGDASPVPLLHSREKSRPVISVGGLIQ